MKQRQWFIDVNGQMDGPFTSETIQSMLLDGVLKIESKIYDVEEDKWYEASTITTHLNPYKVSTPLPQLNTSQNTTQAPSANETGWAPPPKPESLRDVHVVEYDPNLTSELDYFALVGGGRKSADQKDQVGIKKNQVVTTQSKLDEINQGSALFSQAPSMVSDYRKQIGYAAALTLVLAGAYGIYNMSSEKSREVAGEKKSVEKSDRSANESASSSMQASSRNDGIKMSSPSSIGTGKNRVVRESGGVAGGTEFTQTNNARVTGSPSHDQMRDHQQDNNNPPPDTRGNDGGSAGAQFYSTSDDPPNREVAGDGQPPTYPDGAVSQPPPQNQQADPNQNNGVNPPNFNPDPGSPNTF